MPTCLFCGAEIPEGRQICPICESIRIIGVDLASGADTYRRIIAVDFDGTLCSITFPTSASLYKRLFNILSASARAGVLLFFGRADRANNLPPRSIGANVKA